MAAKEFKEARQGFENNFFENGMEHVEEAMLHVRDLNKALGPSPFSKGPSAEFRMSIPGQRLFDDESVREKLTVMSKWDAVLDDLRNPVDEKKLDELEDFLHLGESYDVEFFVRRIDP